MWRGIGKAICATALAGAACVLPAGAQGVPYKVVVNDDGTRCELSIHLPAGKSTGGAPDEASQLNAAMGAIHAGYADNCDPASTIVVTIVTVAARDYYGQANWNKVTSYGEFSIATADVERLRRAADSWPLDQLRTVFKRGAGSR